MQNQPSANRIDVLSLLTTDQTREAIRIHDQGGIVSQQTPSGLRLFWQDTSAPLGDKRRYRSAFLTNIELAGIIASARAPKTSDGNGDGAA